MPSHTMTGVYNFKLVLLSYIVATAASYIALDMTSRLRDIGNTSMTTLLWSIGGALAMGAGIWSMHFIGMQAFKMSIPMSYEPKLTALSLLVAILGCGFTMILLKNKNLSTLRLALGGVVLGLAISTMHYTGMAAMEINMKIHYLPFLFFLSIFIGIVASEFAIWLALKSNQGSLKSRMRLKIMSAFIMGAAICGMHYTGMAAAVFTHLNSIRPSSSFINPELLSLHVATVTFFILGIAFFASTYKEILNYHAVKMARETGKAEVASNVLHNVGNALNSVNISANLIHNCFEKSQLSSLSEVKDLLSHYEDNLESFLSNDPRAKNLPAYILDLANYWEKEKTFLNKEMQHLTKKIQHIKDIINMQQDFCIRAGAMEEIVCLKESLEESLLLAAVDFNKNRINVVKNYEKLGPIRIDKNKFTQIILNLIHNACDALVESQAISKILTIELYHKKSTVFIEINDNGIGISSDNLTRVFLNGFTTKKRGHGFGLHGSALAANEMGGTLQAKSEGLGHGSTFILKVPYKKAA